MDALELKKRLLAAANTLADLGLATLGPAKGSISARDVDTGRVFVTPSGKSRRRQSWSSRRTESRPLRTNPR